MRKEILLPAIAVVGGGAGFALRRWELATAFEPDTGLPIAGAPATMALIALSVAVAAVLLALSLLGKYPRFQGYDQAFRGERNTLYAMAGVLSAFLLIGAGGLIAYEFVQGINQLYTRLIVAVMAVASGVCVLSTVRNSFRAENKGKYSVPLLVPAFAFCVWLIAAYQVRAGDPVRQDYVYELFAIIASLLGLYSTASFSFERGRPFFTCLFSLLGVYFSLVTLADGHDLATILLYAFSIVYLLTGTVTLLHNAARGETPDRDEIDTTEETRDA